MIWAQTSSNRAVDLVEPLWRMIDFEIDMAEGLARIARFNGSGRQGPYSVAQHSVIGADAVFRDTGDRQAAAAFLLHDGREYLLGDKITPVKQAEIAVIAQMWGADVANKVRIALRALGQSADEAIYLAAGMGAEGCPERYREIVKRYDLRMLATEKRHLLGKPPMPWADEVEQAEPLRLVGGLKPWPWPQAADEFRERLRRYLPDFFAPESFATGRPNPGPPKATARRARQPQTTEA